MDGPLILQEVIIMLVALTAEASVFIRILPSLLINLGNITE
jgi:hypothetical protein